MSTHTSYKPNPNPNSNPNPNTYVYTYKRRATSRVDRHAGPSQTQGVRDTIRMNRLAAPRIPRRRNGRDWELMLRYKRPIIGAQSYEDAVIL